MLRSNELEPRILFARLAADTGAPEEAFRVVDEVRENPERFQLNRTNEVALTFVEAKAHLRSGNTNRALELLESSIAAAPDNTNLVNGVLAFLTREQMFTNALSIADSQLNRRPDDVNLLVNKGFYLVRLDQYEPAVAVLTRALELQGDNGPARLNRAIANLQLEKPENLESAKADYEELLLRFPSDPAIYYGLAEIAFLQGVTNQAIHNYRLYLSNAPPNTVEAEQVRQRLESLGSGDP
jgi:tetratricopeptide (TPR) repeat protein